MRRNTFASVAIGGGLGALVRYELSLHLAAATPPAFPSITLAINVVGASVLGLLVTLIVDHWPPTRYLRPLLAMGFLGGFTTLSTFAVESVRLFEAHLPARAIAYVIASLIGGMVGVFTGSTLADVWPLLVRSRRDPIE